MLDSNYVKFEDKISYAFRSKLKVTQKLPFTALVARDSNHQTASAPSVIGPYCN